MAQGPSDIILVVIRITLLVRESKVRNPDPPDWRRFVLSEHSFLVIIVVPLLTHCLGQSLQLTYIETLADIRTMSRSDSISFGPCHPNISQLPRQTSVLHSL